MRYVRFNSNEPFWRNWLILDFEVPSELMFTQIVFWLLLLFVGYGFVALHTLNLMYWNGHFFLTHSTQYPVQEITNLEATAEVKIRYTDIWQMGRDGCKLFAPALQNGSLEWKIFYLTDFLASNLIQKYSQISIRIFLAFHLLERSGCAD